ncbi:MAG: DUF2218 domain-containing protein [Rhodospirillales bacterium]
MMHSEARLATAMAARYLAQLCKHFAHKMKVDHDGNTGRIEFGAGVCSLEAQDGVLIMRAQANDPAALQQVQQVIDRHLERFAFRDKPQIAWRAEAPRETFFA